MQGEGSQARGGHWDPGALVLWPGSGTGACDLGLRQFPPEAYNCGTPTDLGMGLRGLRYWGMLGSCKVKGQALEPESSGRQTEDGREVRKTITIHNSLFNKHVECLLWAQS